MPLHGHRPLTGVVKNDPYVKRSDGASAHSARVVSFLVMLAQNVRDPIDNYSFAIARIGPQWHLSVRHITSSSYSIESSVEILSLTVCNMLYCEVVLIGFVRDKLCLSLAIFFAISHAKIIK